MNAHQATNETNYNTVRIDRYIARSFGLPGWKKLRRVSALGATNGTGARNPLKTSGRREMRTLLESLRKFTISPTHPHGNRDARRKAMKTVRSQIRTMGHENEVRYGGYDARYWSNMHHRLVPRGALRHLDGQLPEDFRD